MAAILKYHQNITPKAMANHDELRVPDTRITFLDATYFDNIDQSPLARAHFSFRINCHILSRYPSADEAPVSITRSGVPITFTEGPAIEIRKGGDRTEIEISVSLRVFGIRKPPMSNEEAEATDHRRYKRVEISISNSHAHTDSNFEGIHSASTRNPLQITDSGRTSHEISLTVRYRIDTINNP